MHLDLFSDPVWGLGGRPGISFQSGPKAVGYDEDLLKPAILLADTVTLRTHRLDVQTFMGIEASAVRLAVPVIAKMQAVTSGNQKWLAEAAGIGDILDELTSAAATARKPNGEMDIDIVQRPVVEEFARRLHHFYRTAYTEFAAPSFKNLIREGILTESRWDSRDYSRMSIPEARHESSENSFAVGFEKLLSGLESSSTPIMIDRGIGDRIADSTAGSDMNTSEVLSNAADLLRAVDALSDASFDEIIDIRRDLEQYFRPFRSFILDIAKETTFPPGASIGERRRTMNIEWETNVAPAVHELKAHLESSGFAKNLMRVSFEKTESMLAIGMGIMGAIGAGVLGIATLGGAALGVAPIIAGAARASRDNRKSARQNPAFFIYEFEKKLAERR